MNENTYGSMKIGEGIRFSLDTRQTKVNNNVLVVGASGSGKTTGVVIPNLLELEGSYVVSDPKGTLYQTYGAYMKLQGYQVKRVSFSHPEESVPYNFFHYIHSEQDVLKIAHMLVYAGGIGGHPDPFWDRSSELVLTAIIGYIWKYRPKNQQGMRLVQKLMLACRQDSRTGRSPMDGMIDEIREQDPYAFVVTQYDKFNCASEKTRSSILATVFSVIGAYDFPKLARMLTDTDQVNVPELGEKKTAIFVEVSDSDRSLDPLVNLFFTQVMNELCSYADTSCRGYRLPVPVRFFMDDFATNCIIADFPRMISSIRSRGISTVLMIQAEGQLYRMFGEDAQTIIGNCDTYVYLGGNDLETAARVGRRSDCPLEQVLNMPVGMMWIFRRGQAPWYGPLERADVSRFERLQDVEQEQTEEL